MYISGQRDVGRRRAEEISIPERYSGNAFPGQTENLRSDSGALEEAEAAFKRGYVFEDNTIESESEPQAVSIETEVSAVQTSAPESEAITVHKKAAPKRQGGLFDRLTNENIILIALILILWDSKADDELLLMLIILFFC